MLIEVLASIVLLFFVAYETGGDAGHYRTVINQLLSCFYGGVRYNIQEYQKVVYSALWCVLKISFEDFQSFKLLSLILAVFWYIMAGLN